MATKPEFPPGQDMMDVSPADLAEAKERAKARKAYDQATTSTPPAPKPESKPKKLATGGSVGSASRRADGIAQRGKTRGTMVMCGGGYMKGK
jgi:hypothetical protein